MLVQKAYLFGHISLEVGGAFLDLALGDGSQGIFVDPKRLILHHIPRDISMSVIGVYQFWIEAEFAHHLTTQIKLFNNPKTYKEYPSLSSAQTPKILPFPSRLAYIPNCISKCDKSPSKAHFIIINNKCKTDSGTRPSNANTRSTQSYCNNTEEYSRSTLN